MSTSVAWEHELQSWLEADVTLPDIGRSEASVIT
jgi:hypothetical protein